MTLYLLYLRGMVCKVYDIVLVIFVDGLGI